ncbi:excinuclease ABC subunit UvrB [Arthrospira platensis]|uniref:UvrABC system protein B n=1 Tax=Limnospira platensis NIES-46 TaxID=1236695 RepID=A0A5M3T764_LIMPL|nr:excinuclease ABC subunit UvrB [Arthrospira platensis]AMW29218.1 excinuclease ABC subunit B [Arthrospira platensis YZ]KDR57206.1 excinuclease ABC subunit B [Arthrospira platensis str. Paraca]MBD2709661.1 excinuclease ABC subunit UvrB [Arthrospira platensis FACHB-835]MDF2213092.1 excinuclease ABC subunit UvrB [Arthrospira platensis NCB002]MDT9183565.1 excinuclease ABC subunit UvrB [Limnospira sp. PMC 289.06]MDT9295663.1 excinuclease ABC subunit UvrB [Arthrospira platensis PCC 7345]MDT930985
MVKFELKAPFQPTGDQPLAIAQLINSIKSGHPKTTLLGATGTGKTFTIAATIAQLGRPTLVLAHNKTLAAQLCNELREFFPNNAVEYFISYYDYYQPEAYIPVSDTYIEKTASINDEIDMLRHSATRSLFERRDVIVVASISCIYGLGIPTEYLNAAIPLRVGEDRDQRQLLRDLASIQYSRNDTEITRGRFRVRGDVLEIGPAYEDRIIRVEFFGDEIDAIRYIDPVTGEVLQSLETLNIYPARHFVTPGDRLDAACDAIAAELKQQLAELEKAGKLWEAQRLDQRTRYDLEMLREVGYCNGVENYSRHLAGRLPGSPPECLVDYFPDDWLLVVDESHVTVPQIRAMYNGDQARKKVLIEHGFRLPSAADNRPLKSEEFWQKVKQCILVSATPGDWEIAQSQGQVIEQVIRPTGVVDPEIFVRPTTGQVDDLIAEIKERIPRNERVLVTTLTKRMAEDLTEYFQDRGIRVRYLHSEIQSIQRIEIIQSLQEGEFDVLIGVNLLREGLDLPQVSLVAILDADKEGFLRAERSLIQTIGRAARHVRGQAILYADNMTDSMSKAIAETNRRRTIQLEYNQKYGIIPKSIVKSSSNAILAFLDVSRRLNSQQIDLACQQVDDLPLEEIPTLIEQLEVRMNEAAQQLEFEEAAKFRDRIRILRDKLVGR